LSENETTRLWGTVLGELEVTVSRPNFKTWFAKTTGLSHENGVFNIGAPNTFVAEYLERNQRSLIEKMLIKKLGVAVRASFTVAGISASGSGRSSANGNRFNPRYTFDSFVVGGANRLAHAAAMAAAQSSGEGYNPLFIHGSSGLGKSHLLQAIGQEAISKSKRVRYLTGEQFTQEFVASLKERRMDDFKAEFHQIDMLLIDDVQFVAGKAATEDCLFHTFNELHDSKRQIVLASDSSPQEMGELAERLRTRFSWGLAVELGRPDEATRQTIIASRAAQLDLELSQAVVEIIAAEAARSIRELEGALNRVVAYCRLLHAAVTPELAHRALKSVAEANVPQLKSPEKLIAVVASSFDLTAADLTGERRDKDTALARHVAMYLLREQNILSLAEVGRTLNRNASTVSHACARVTEDLLASPVLARRVNDIKSRLH